MEEIYIVPKNVEQINDHLFIDTYNSNNTNIGVNDMTVNDSEICEMKRRSLVNTGDRLTKDKRLTQET